MSIKNPTPEQKFVTQLAWCSQTLAIWAQNQLRNGFTFDEVKHQLKRAIELSDRK